MVRAKQLLVQKDKSINVYLSFANIAEVTTSRIICVEAWHRLEGIR